MFKGLAEHHFSHKLVPKIKVKTYTAVQLSMFLLIELPETLVFF
jgi:hypothetical protein